MTSAFVIWGLISRPSQEETSLQLQRSWGFSQTPGLFPYFCTRILLFVNLPKSLTRSLLKVLLSLKTLCRLEVFYGPCYRILNPSIPGVSVQCFVCQPPLAP